jgi:hypothetical protein
MATLPTVAEQPSRFVVTLTAGARRVLSFPVLLGVSLVAGCVFLAKGTFLDPDTWWHIVVGQRILATHSWPWSDSYSWTASGAPWIAYEWLGEVVMGAAASVAGLRFATFLLVALGATLTLLLYYYATLRSGNSKGAFVACAILFPILGAFFTLRPQLLGAIFLVVTLIVLEKFRQGRDRALWLLPPLFLAWVNTHGTFVFGFFVLGVAWLSGQFEFSAGGLWAERWTKRQSVQLLLSIFGSALVLPITPYGTRLAAYPLSMAFNQPVNIKVIVEWMPLGSQMVIGGYFVAVMLMFFMALLIERPRFQLPDIALAATAAAMACIHIRFLLLFVIFVTPLWSMLFARWVPPYRAERDRPILNAILIGAIALGSFWLFPSQQDIDRQIDAKYPRAAVRYLADHPIADRLFNEYGWGGYLIWSNPRQKRVFIDGRADFYEYGGVLTDYVRIMRLDPGALQLLNRYAVGACLIPNDAGLGTALSAMPGWTRIYEDQVAVLYVRRPQQTHN